MGTFYAGAWRWRLAARVAISDRRMLRSLGFLRYKSQTSDADEPEDVVEPSTDEPAPAPNRRAPCSSLGRPSHAARPAHFRPSPSGRRRPPVERPGRSSPRTRPRPDNLSHGAEG